MTGQSNGEYNRDLCSMSFVIIANRHRQNQHSTWSSSPRASVSSSILSPTCEHGLNGREPGEDADKFISKFGQIHLAIWTNSVSIWMTNVYRGRDWPNQTRRETGELGWRNMSLILSHKRKKIKYQISSGISIPSHPIPVPVSCIYRFCITEAF